MKTFMPKKAEITRKWYLVDAADAVLGRLSTRLANILMGKDKVTYTPHVDMADQIVVINAAKIRVTGKKPTKKTYRHYTGYPGGLREETFEHLLRRKPEEVIYHAVRGMLPHNRLGRDLITRLKVYADEKHPHIAQKPVKINL